MTRELTSPEHAPQPGTYRHYKGPMYQVLGMAQHSETDEWMVVYQALYGEYGFWLRPLSVWLEPVEDQQGAQTEDASSDNTGTSKPNHTTSQAVANATSHTRQRFELVTLSSSSLNQLTKKNPAADV